LLEQGGSLLGGMAAVVTVWIRLNTSIPQPLQLVQALLFNII